MRDDFLINVIDLEWKWISEAISVIWFQQFPLRKPIRGKNEHVVWSFSLDSLPAINLSRHELSMIASVEASRHPQSFHRSLLYAQAFLFLSTFVESEDRNCFSVTSTLTPLTVFLVKHCCILSSWLTGLIPFKLHQFAHNHQQAHFNVNWGSLKAIFFKVKVQSSGGGKLFYT